MNVIESGNKVYSGEKRDKRAFILSKALALVSRLTECWPRPVRVVRDDIPGLLYPNEPEFFDMRLRSHYSPLVLRQMDRLGEAVGRDDGNYAWDLERAAALDAIGYLAGMSLGIEYVRDFNAEEEAERARRAS